MEIKSTTGAEAVSHGGVEYKANEHGVFAVPEEVGRALVRFPGWAERHVAEAAADVEKKIKEADPARLAERLAAVEGRLALLEAKMSPLAGTVVTAVEDGVKVAEAIDKVVRRAKPATAKATSAKAK